MALDPTKHADWEIAEEAETRMKTAYQLADELGLEKEELLPHGHYVAKVDFNKVLKRLEKNMTGNSLTSLPLPQPLWVRENPLQPWDWCRVWEKEAKRLLAPFVNHQEDLL